MSPARAWLWLTPTLLLLSCAGAAPRAASPAAAPVAAAGPSARDAFCNMAEAPAPPGAAASPRTEADVDALLAGSESPPTPTSVHVRMSTPGRESEVRAAIRAQAGRPVPSAVIAGDIHRIWSLGGIDDVVVQIERSPAGPVLVYVVRDDPRIARVLQAGRGVPSIDARSTIGLHPGDLFAPVPVHDRLTQFLAQLRDEGYLHADAELRTQPAGPSQVDVCVVVREGPRVTIRAVEFTGNNAASPAELRLVMESSRGEVNTEGGVYRPDALDLDLLRISAWYYDKGMLASRVGPAIVDEAPDHTTLTLRIPIEEGPVYRIGAIELAGKLIAPKSEYAALLSSRKGAVASRATMMRDLQAIRDFHAAKGHPGVDVYPETNLDPATSTVSITFRVP